MLVAISSTISPKLEKKERQKSKVNLNPQKEEQKRADKPKDIRRFSKVPVHRLKRHVIPIALPVPALFCRPRGDVSTETSSAEDRSGVDPRGPGREPKVADLERTLGGDQDVGRFEIEVEDPLRMDVVQTLPRQSDQPTINNNNKKKLDGLHHSIREQSSTLDLHPTVQPPDRTLPGKTPGCRARTVQSG